MSAFVLDIKKRPRQLAGPLLFPIVSPGGPHHARPKPAYRPDDVGEGRALQLVRDQMVWKGPWPRIIDTMERRSH